LYMLDTFHLRTFVTVVEAGNYSAAAEKLHMSQPATSQHIHGLEEQLDGVRLFRRVGKRMVPTYAGEELLQMARELVALADRAEASIKALKGQVGGQARVGCTSSSGELLLAPLLAAFRTRFPAVGIQVQVAPTSVLLEGLAQQTLGIVLLEDHQRRRGWEAQLLGSEQLVLLAQRGHPWLQQEHVPIGALSDQPLIMPPLGSPLRRGLDDALRRRGLSPTRLSIVLETESVSLAINGVRAGLGMAFIPQICQPQGHDLEAVSLSGAPLQHEWFVLRARDEGAPQSLSELFAFLTSTEAQGLLAQVGLRPPVGKS